MLSNIVSNQQPWVPDDSISQDSNGFAQSDASPVKSYEVINECLPDRAWNPGWHLLDTNFPWVLPNVFPSYYFGLINRLATVIL